MQPKYRKVLLKFSSESLTGGKEHGTDFSTVLEIYAPIEACVDPDVQANIVAGGGNFWRGRSSGEMGRTRADHIGILATVINAFDVVNVLEQLGVPIRAQTAATAQQIAEPYICNHAVCHLEKGRVVVFGCDTGNPFFSTDTAASLRTAEIDADIIIKATLMGDMYDSDPRLNGMVVKFDSLSSMDVLNKGLHAMDSMVVALCENNDISILVLNITDPEDILRAVCGEPIGTLVK